MNALVQGKADVTLILNTIAEACKNSIATIESAADVDAFVTATTSAREVIGACCNITHSAIRRTVAAA
ncbi:MULTISPECIES: hypothetical protein [unclassified Caballeronia]|uniref:hypothetical protein n=1 Tax=unclassified Caballeronia TaxID=2646786 RepID=UPI002858418E|nr:MULTISPECIES: hypothetical protein [unclassified Caballeronia]MDR5751133.1 hypothetical protein [Caballeronia sp. LZ024]MDR5844730.1 hypothetical protein [Caballeronia sp. LZ031]